MAQNVYVTVTGQKQGKITGSVIQKGREGSILVHAYNHSIISPRDPASGLPTGKRQHQPLTILKENDRSTPLLWSALVNNENLTSVVLNFWTVVAANGAQKLTYSITLTNANISSIKDSLLDNEDPALAAYPQREEISFTYQKIQWTWTEGGITASDDWESPVV